MSYTNLSWVKLFLGITGTSEDALLNSYIAQTKSLLDHLIGDLTVANRTFSFDRCDLVGNHLRLMTRNITAIVSIDGVPYTWVLNIDYKILNPYKSLLWVKDIYWLLVSETPYHDIVVTSWLSPIPDDLILLQNLMVAWLYNSKNGMEVKSYKLWDRSFTFAIKGESENDFMTASSIIDLYTMLDYV